MLEGSQNIFSPLYILQPQLHRYQLYPFTYLALVVSYGIINFYCIFLFSIFADIYIQGGLVKNLGRHFLDKLTFLISGLPLNTWQIIIKN